VFPIKKRNNSPLNLPFVLSIIKKLYGTIQLNLFEYRLYRKLITLHYKKIIIIA